MAATLAVALYLPTVGYGWVYDDQFEVVRNAFVRSFAHVPSMFTTTVWTGSGVETYLYRPLALVSYAANYALVGLAPWSYHLVNVLLHAGVAVLVVRVGMLWRLPVAAAGLAGILFAVHPVHVEAVAAVFGRKDLLATLFILATLLSHRRGLDRGGVHAVPPLLCYALAMLSKEIGVVALPLMLLQDLRLESDWRAFFDRRRVLIVYLGSMAVLVAYLLVRVAVTGGFGIADTSPLDNPLVAASLPVRLATAAVVLAKGVGLLLVPFTLSPDYSFEAIPLVTSPVDPRLLAVLCLSAVLAWGLARPTTPPALRWAAAAYGIAIFPVSNLAVITGTIFAERLLYLPSAVFCLAGGAALMALASGRPWARLGPTLVVGGVILTLGARTVRYSAAWTDDIALFGWAVQAQPRSTKAHHKLGEELLRAGRIGEAFEPLDRALLIAPDNGYARETLVTAIRLAAADTARGPALLRRFVAAGAVRHPNEVALARALLRQMEAAP